MEVIQTYIVKTKIVLETLNYQDGISFHAYSLLYECEKNYWFINLNDRMERISPESAIHIKCMSQQVMK